MSKSDSIARAQEWLLRSPVFLDTETTSLEGQICEIAIVDNAGEILLNTLVKPAYEMDDAARATHGITDDMLADAPTFDTLWLQLRDLLAERFIVIYNADFDKKCIANSARDARGDPILPLWQEVYDNLRRRDIGCAMELYAEFYGDWMPRRGAYKWHKLLSAAREFGLPEQDHRALGDAQLCRGIVQAIAAVPVAKEIA